jgi:TolB-like protein/lipopolysaccharide biosynthesis regulator YciM
MSDDPDQEYFSDGLSEELLNLLAKIPELKVIGRTSSFSFKGKNEDLREIGRKLGVSYLMEGSVRKSGDKIRVTAQLINAADGSHLWSDIYDRELVEIFAVQDEIAAKVVDQLKISIPGLIESTPVAKNMEAYNLILEANYIVQQPGSRDKRIALIERAIALDSSDARIWAELAKVYHWWWGGNHILRRERAEMAREAAEKAIIMDKNNAMGHWALGKILWAFYWDWGNAEKELRMAEELSTEYIGARAELYQSFGRWEEAINAGKRKIEVDPIDPSLWRLLGFIYLNAGDPEKAIPNLERALELLPNYDTPWIELGWAYCQLGKFDQALEALNHVQDRDIPRLLDFLGRSYYALGNISKSDLYFQKLLESDGEVDNSIFIASAFARRGEADKCFEWVQIAYERKHPAMSLIKGEAFSEIKELKDARYEEFLLKMNLPVD